MSILGVLSLIGILQLNLTLLIFIQFNCAKRKPRKSEQQKNGRGSKKSTAPEALISVNQNTEFPKTPSQGTENDNNLKAKQKQPNKAAPAPDAAMEGGGADKKKKDRRGGGGFGRKKQHSIEKATVSKETKHNDDDTSPPENDDIQAPVQRAAANPRDHDELKKKAKMTFLTHFFRVCFCFLSFIEKLGGFGSRK